jgi:hypothetical protein
MTVLARGSRRRPGYRWVTDKGRATVPSNVTLPNGVHDLALHYELEDRERSIHPAAVETDRGVVLVDVGLPSSADRIARALETEGLAMSDVAVGLATRHDGIADVHAAL